uniref:Uncharacterized protein n=1 Tax=Meloidogyne javanica TaxID=6303 RepID=A0A915M149_MELJA
MYIFRVTSTGYPEVKSQISIKRLRRLSDNNLIFPDPELPKLPQDLENTNSDCLLWQYIQAKPLTLESFREEIKGFCVVNNSTENNNNNGWCEIELNLIVKQFGHKTLKSFHLENEIIENFDFKFYIQFTKRGLWQVVGIPNCEDGCPKNTFNVGIKFPFSLLKCSKQIGMCCTNENYLKPLKKGKWCLNWGKALGKKCTTNNECKSSKRPQASCVDRECCTRPREIIEEEKEGESDLILKESSEESEENEKEKKKNKSKEEDELENEEDKYEDDFESLESGVEKEEEDVGACCASMSQNKNIWNKKSKRNKHENAVEEEEDSWILPQKQKNNG